MYGIIYIAINKENNMVYVGQTIRELEIRKMGRYNDYFTKALQKYEFEWKIIDRSETQEKLDDLERHYIELYNAMYPNGYCFETGGTSNHTISEETRKKMSFAQKKRFLDPKERAKLASFGMLGKKHSEETKRWMSENSVFKRPEVRQKISLSKMGD